MKKISVSILSSKNVHKDIVKVNSSTADYLHIDVCDGKFVKNKFNPFKLLYKLYPSMNTRLDVHLMVKKPKKFINKYALLNTEYITVHLEIERSDKYIKMIKDYGIKVGLAINPDTDESAIVPYLHDVDMITLMSVYPGKGGQEFIDDTIKKIIKVKKLIVKEKVDVKIEVDGGVNDEVAKRLDFADVIVSGSFVTKSEDFTQSVETLRKNADKLKTTKRTERRKIKEENAEKKAKRPKKTKNSKEE